MHKNINYRILIVGLRVGLGLLAATGLAKAQEYHPGHPDARGIVLLRGDHR